MSNPTRLDLRHLRHHTHRAITGRLRYSAPDALIDIQRDGDTALIHVNSGGNALAVEAYLRQRGYHAEFEPLGNDTYGEGVRVWLRSATSSLPDLT